MRRSHQGGLLYPCQGAAGALLVTQKKEQGEKEKEEWEGRQEQEEQEQEKELLRQICDNK